MIYNRYLVEENIYNAIDSLMAANCICDPPVVGIGAPGCVARFHTEADQALFLLASPAFLHRDTERYDLDLVLPIDIPFGLPVIKDIFEQCSLSGRVMLFDLHEIGFSSLREHSDFIRALMHFGFHAKIYKAKDIDEENER